MSDYRLVDLGADVVELQGLANADLVGVDTEFMREKTYFAELCLVQVATRDGILCIDPLAPTSAADRDGADAAWRTLLSPGWVLHSARQDFEVVYQAAGRLPPSVFDTQVAAGLLGFQPQLGYAALVKALFGKELPKSHTRADWSRRPVTAALLSYAAEDVEFLLPAYDELSRRLDKAGRLAWAMEDSAELLDETLYRPDPDTAVDRLKAAGKLRGGQRAAAAALARWREREAIRANKPRQWIVRDAVLVALALSSPGTVDELSAIDGLSPKTVARAGDKLLAILEEAANSDSDYRPPPSPDESQKAALKEMQKRVAACAERLDIAAEILAPRRELAAAMTGRRDGRVFRGWRGELIGESLLEVLGD